MPVAPKWGICLWGKIRPNIRPSLSTGDHRRWSCNPQDYARYTDNIIARIGCTEILPITTKFHDFTTFLFYYNGLSIRVDRTLTNDAVSLDLFDSLAFVFARFHIRRHLSDARPYTHLPFSWNRSSIYLTSHTRIIQYF